MRQALAERCPQQGFPKSGGIARAAKAAHTPKTAWKELRFICLVLTQLSVAPARDKGAAGSHGSGNPWANGKAGRRDSSSSQSPQQPVVKGTQQEELS